MVTHPLAGKDSVSVLNSLHNSAMLADGQLSVIPRIDRRVHDLHAGNADTRQRWALGVRYADRGFERAESPDFRSDALCFLAQKQLFACVNELDAIALVFKAIGETEPLPSAILAIGLAGR